MLIVTPNPCLDITVRLAALVPGTVSRATSTLTTAGGKGVNVARAARALGEPDVRLAAPLPGVDGGRYAELLADEGTELVAIPVPGVTRIATIFLEDSGRVSVVNGRGPDIGAASWDQFRALVAARLRPGDVMVCSGSLPPGLPADAYGQLVRIAHEAGCRAVVDAAPLALAAALQSGPDLVSPNLAEAEGLLFGRVDEQVDEVGDDIPQRAIAAARRLHAGGAKLAVVTAGGAGAAFVCAVGEGWIPSPPVTVANPIGAGDAFAAGAAVALRQGMTGAAVVRHGMAAASASCEQELAGTLDPARAAELLAALTRAETPPHDATSPRPLLMPPNVIDHFYLGGEHIAELRGVDLPSPRRPEEWLAATVHRAGDDLRGLSTTSGGALLRDVIAADPIGWLGTAENGAGVDGDTGILVKLLDAGQRLPVHVHPTRAFARDHLHCGYGKTEAWYILSTDGDDPAVWVGFATDVDPDELRDRVEAQDSAWMLAHLNKIPVRPGDGVVVPAGTAHATGAGVFLVEVQEPTDFSILLEWSVTTSTREESHLGLGFDTVMPVVDHRARTGAALTDLLCHVDVDATSADPMRALSPAADEFFRLDVLAPPAGGETAVPAGFAVVVVLDGTGSMSPPAIRDHAARLDVRRGEVLAVPAGYGDWRLHGSVRAVLCRPSADWPENVRRPLSMEAGG